MVATRVMRTVTVFLPPMISVWEFQRGGLYLFDRTSDQVRNTTAGGDKADAGPRV